MPMNRKRVFVNSIILGFVLSLIWHFLILFPLSRHKYIERKPRREFVDKKDDDTIFLEDVVLPEKDREKKKEEKKEEKKPPKEIVTDYRKVPWIDPDQEFTIKRNKAPKAKKKTEEKRRVEREIIRKVERESLLPEEVFEKAALSPLPSLEGLGDSGRKSYGQEGRSGEAADKPIVLKEPERSFFPDMPIIIPDMEPALKRSEKGLTGGRAFNLDELGRGSGLWNPKRKGSNFGRLFIEDESFQNEWYARVIVSKVAHNWFLPGIAYSGASGIVVVSFSIVRVGEIKNQKISKKSGYSSIDKSASNAVSLSNAFPPLPKDYPKDKLKINFAFYVNVYPGSQKTGRRR